MGIPKRFAFDNIMTDENGNEIGDQELYDLFYNKKNKRCNCFMRILVNNLKFKNIKFKLKGIHNLKLIMKKLQELDVNNLSVKYDLIGTIYEIHLRSGSSNAMRDLGQYYTHRLVIDYMVKLCDIKMIDGMIEKIVDPTMGTGGFLTMAIKELNSKYQNIDWTKNKDNIIGFDIDDNVKNMALLNIFLEIGEMCDNTIVKQDTLQNDMMFENGTILNKVKILLANEPMGIKGIKHASCCNRIKELKIRGTKAEPLFLQLFMEALDDNGRCAVIIPDGVLFNESNMHKNTRKYLIENFNLQKIISLDDKEFFLNTGVKTSILFFTKDGKKTEDVLFSKISITENEEIKEEDVIKVSYDDILEKNYSLFVNKYDVEEEEKIEGVEYKKLGDVCEFLKKSKRKASYGKKEGNFPFYTSSMKSKRCDVADFKEECIIIGTGGNANINFDNLFSCSTDNFILKIKDKSINIKYIYYYLFNNIKILENGFSGSTIKHISKSYVKDLKIPIPSLDIQNEIVKRLDVLSGNNKTLEKNIDEFKKIMKYYVHSHTLMCEKKEYKKLSDVCDFLGGKYRKIKEAKEKGKCNFYTCSIFKYNHLKINKPDFEDEALIMNAINGSGKCNIYLDKNYSLTSNNIHFKIKNNNIKIQYLYNYLKSNLTLLENGFIGSNQQKITKSYIKDIKIPIPSLDIQNEIVEYCDNLNNMIENMESQLDKNNVLMKNILENYLNSQTINDETN
jgi:type I restriction enzyme S subunit